MIKRYLTASAGAALCVTLAACSTTPRHNPNADNQLVQKTVHYECHAPGDRRVNLEAQYTFQGTGAVTAQVIYDDQAIPMTRDTNSKANLVGDTFTGNGYTWTTGQFTVDTAEKVNGNMLTRSDAVAASGGGHANTILARNCVVQGRD